MKHLIGLLFLGAVGCTQMTVRVEILEPTVLKGTSAWVRADIKTHETKAIPIARDPNGAARDFFLTIEDSLKAYQSAMYSVNPSKGKHWIFDYYENRIFTAFREAGARTGDVSGENKNAQEATTRTTETLVAAVPVHFLHGDRVLLQLQQEITSDLNSSTTHLVPLVGRNTASQPSTQADAAAHTNHRRDAIS